MSMLFPVSSLRVIRRDAICELLLNRIRRSKFQQLVRKFPDAPHNYPRRICLAIRWFYTAVYSRSHSAIYVGSVSRTDD